MNIVIPILNNCRNRIFLSKEYQDQWKLSFVKGIDLPFLLQSLPGRSGFWQRSVQIPMHNS